MTSVPNEAKDLSLVAAIFGEHGLEVLRFSKLETRAGKTPDFRIMKDNALVAYGEVKSPRDEWLDDLLDRTEPGQIAHGLRNDPIFNRLSKLVEKASEQLDAVNPDRSVPNILVIVNHDKASHFGDLVETLTGTFHAIEGPRHPTMPQVSEGRIREAKRRIDLYVWIDGQNDHERCHLFSRSIPAHVDSLCTMLGLSAPQILQ